MSFKLQGNLTFVQFTGQPKGLSELLPTHCAVLSLLVNNLASATGMLYCCAGTKACASTTQASGQQQSTYVSYNLPLKPSVPRFNSPPRQQQQQQLRPEGSSSPYGRTAAGPAVALPLSQLLQHPALGSALNGHQQQQQQQMMMLDRSLPQQLLQQYQQEHPQLVLQQLQQQQQQLQQQMHAAVMAVQAGSGHQQQQQQQQQQVRSSLPELRQSESPQPPGQPGEDSPHQHQQQHQQQQQQQASPDGPAAVGSATAEAGLLGTGSSLGLSTGSLGGQGHHRSCYHQQHPQQQQYDGTGLTASRSSLGGISAAATKVLQTSQPSFYDGAGPLTSGTKPVWTSGNQRTVQAGQDLAQVSSGQLLTTLDSLHTYMIGCIIPV
jgi:hypothetical protein